jgi:hypothetical protein
VAAGDETSVACDQFRRVDLVNADGRRVDVGTLCPTDSGYSVIITPNDLPPANR